MSKTTIFLSGTMEPFKYLTVVGMRVVKLFIVVLFSLVVVFCLVCRVLSDLLLNCSLLSTSILGLIGNLVVLLINTVGNVELSVILLAVVLDELICFPVDSVEYLLSDLMVELVKLTNVDVAKGVFSTTDLVYVVGIKTTFMVGFSLSGLGFKLEILGNVVVVEIVVFTIGDLVIAVGVIFNFSVAKVLFIVKGSIVELEIFEIIVIEGVLIIFELLF